ncbi:hypothetical protein AAC387_Pa11g0337 [Persea americana]
MQGFQSVFGIGSDMYYRHVSATICRAVNKTHTRTMVLFVVAVFVGAFISTRWIDATITSSKSTKPILTAKAVLHEPSYQNPTPPKKPSHHHQTGSRAPTQPKILKTHHKQTPQNPLLCPSENHTRTCPARGRPSPTVRSYDDVDPPSCPDYFRWIHEDLRPWKARGISKEMVERAKRTATFRVVVLDGRVYLERFKRAFQTRDVYTLWGILQLVRLYPGLVPDLELMFDCVDWPVVMSRDYGGRNASAPPPLFRYCGDEETLDIVFPDWSFWGWPEINLKPWESLLKDLKEGNERVKWMNREPYAYWKGNPAVAPTRQDLLKCNVSERQDWNARLYAQDWISESQQGYKQSDLASQCTHRYKIYIEGSAWSVSEKYILACNSPTLIVKPRYYDFFTRGLMPVHHYWPIREDDKCRSIKFAVNWGNSHKQKAQAIANTASNFIQEDLKMEYVYDYMFHLLNEYAELLTYKPTKPKKAVEICLESMVCPARGLEKKFMVESMVKAPKESSPCTLPPPFDPVTLRVWLRRKQNSIRQVEIWEKGAWESQNTKL